METQNKLQSLENKIINFSETIGTPFARFAIFLVYFWFGALKVFDLSPAGPMVLELLEKTMPFFPPNLFLILFGLFEILIGVMFLIPRLTKQAVVLIVIHLFTTIIPLFLMSQFTWNGFLQPSLEGQYIIKNILILALLFVVIGSEAKRRLK